MTFDYIADFRTQTKPGDRLWACGLRLNPAMTRRVRDMKPALVEICCTTSKDTEADARAKGRYPQYAVPVAPDGTLRFSKATGPSDLHFYKDYSRCAARYDALAGDYAMKMAEAVQELQAFRQEILDGRAAAAEADNA